MVRVAVIGNIGAGKTSLVNHLAKATGWPIALEPVQRWTDSGFLSAFYNETKKYAFSFQIYAFITKIMSYENETSDNLIMDAFVITDRAFMKALQTQGFITAEEMNWYDSINQDLQVLVRDHIKPDLIIYLALDPKTCLERIHSRDRQEEKQLTLSYLETLGHELDIIAKEHHGYHIITIDASLSEEEILFHAQQACDLFIKKQERMFFQ